SRGGGTASSVQADGVGAEPGDETAGRPHARKRARRRQLSRNWTLFLLFAGPNILLILGFLYYPLVSNISCSTLDWRLGSPRATPVGLDDYVRFSTSPSGVEVWRVTGIF